MIHPTIHSNGTSKQALYDQMRAAWDALRAARRAIADAAPNGRDYYPQGDEAFREAVRQHHARLKAVGEAMADYEVMLMHLVYIYGSEGIQ